MEPLTAIGLFIAGTLIGGAIAFYFCQSSTPVPDSEMRNRLIKNSEALSVIKNKKEDNSGDLMSGHLPMNAILPYIKFLEKESLTAVENVAGIEFYFTRQTNSNGDLSFLLYPTYLRNDGEYIPFDPIASKNELVELKDMRRISFPEPSDNQKSMAENSGGENPNGDNLVALNRANMSPPRQHTW